MKKMPFDIYEHAEYRYALGTKGKRTLFCLGLNPSTADDVTPDPTIRKVANVVYKRGAAEPIDFGEEIDLCKEFDSFVMLNIYPLRATDPNDLPLDSDDSIKKVTESCEHKKNVEHILNLVKDDSVIWAAWGNLDHSRDWLGECLKDIIAKLNEKRKNITWVNMGLNDTGEPRHPLFVKYQKFSPYVDSARGILRRP